MKTIQINYMDDHGNLMGRHETDDAYSPEEIAQWNEWLNDNSTEHPSATAGWTQFELVPTCALCPDGHHGAGYSCHQS